MAANLKVAIITGASSGIGRASAVALYRAGWSLMLTGRRPDALKETVDECIKNGQSQGVETLPGDITEESFVASLFEKTRSAFGRIDLLFNNAGVGAPAVPIEELSVSAFLNAVNTNLVAPFLCTREAVRQFKSQSPPGGRIINNGSISAHVPRPHSAPYTSTKHAITGLTKSTILDGRAFGIECTQIDIGNALTPLTQRMSKEENTEKSESSGGVLQADGTSQYEATFDVNHVADMVVHVAGLPIGVSVPTLTIMATKMPYVGRG